MATPNFSVYNADNFYVVYDFDEVTQISLQNEVREELAGKNLFVKDIHEYDGDRDYPALYVSEVNREFEFCGISVCVSIELGARTGYYSGCNLDYSVKVECGNAWSWIEPFVYIGTDKSYYSYKSVNELADAFVDEIDDCGVCDRIGVSKGLFRMNKRRMAKRVADEMDRMIELANELCKKFCDNEYDCVAKFSNGEAIYELVS